MSLFKQLVIMLTLFLGVILASVMLLNFKSATEFVQNQLYADAKNTAHSLGLSLSKVADPSDSSSMETMINAIYDSGYYQRIRLVDIDGKVVYVREGDVRVSDVPQWFIHNVPIHNASATSDIMIGWSRFGTLEVSGHTGNAYRQLYSTLIDLIQTFLMIGIVVFVALYLLLSLSLKSLKRIRDQAKAIIDNEFIIETTIPFTTEFRSVTIAMNAMVTKVKDIFERENETLRRYHELLYKDTETKLYNRRYISSKFPEYLQSDTHLSSGTYAMFSFQELERFKKEMGFESYRQLLIAFADSLSTLLSETSNALVARLNESDFIVIAPSLETSECVKQMEEAIRSVKDTLSHYNETPHEYLDLGCGIGTYSEKDTLKSLFSRADHAVTQAKLKSNFAIDVSKGGDETLILGREEWRQELLLSLQESRMLLAFQSVVDLSNDSMSVLHEEIFLRLLDREGTIHSAGYFIPVATSLGLVDTLDRYMISHVLSYLKSQQSSSAMAINLSADFIKKYANVEWLKEELTSFSKQSDKKLWIEVSNTIALSELEAVRSLSAVIKQHSHHFGIDHFALPEGGASYLQIIRPDYVKSNAGYLLDMMIDNETGNKRESMNNLVKSLGISIVAIMIENAVQLEELKALGIVHFQGSHIAPVTMLK